MNALIQEQLLEEIRCQENLAYVFADNRHFLATEYKVLINQGELSGFVKCMKMLYNGKIQIYYMLHGYKAFSGLISTVSPEQLMVIVANLFNCIMKVKSNGFLSCSNIDLSFEHVYVEPSTLKIGLVYLPASIHFYPDEDAFENELRSGLINIITNTSGPEGQKVTQLVKDLSDGLLNLKDLAFKLQMFSNVGEKKEERIEERKFRESVLYLAPLNTNRDSTIKMEGDEFIIGKKPELVNFVIDYNKLISRIHCKINRVNGGFEVTDLSSTNGTYLNRIRLVPNQSYPVKNGDSLKLANSSFKVIVK